MTANQAVSNVLLAFGDKEELKKAKRRECERRYREKNREALLEKRRAYQKEYREKNHDALLEYQRAYQKANREEVRRKRREWYKRKREAEGHKVTPGLGW